MNPPIDLLGAIIGGLTLAAAVMVVTSRLPIHAACFLILTLLGVAGQYAVLEAHTLAVFQVLVYAGAIVVLIAFVLMLLGSGRDDEEPVELGSWRVVVGGVMAVALTGLFFVAMRRETMTQASDPVPRDFGRLEGLGELLLGPYVLAFEVISVVLMVAIVGAVALLRSRTTRDQEEPQR
jgi:NADH-quinone oxidoreductase subunit J